MEIGAEVELAAVPAGAGIRRGRAVVGQGGDFGVVPAADRAVNADRIIGLPLPLRRVLGAELVENIEDASARRQRLHHIRRVPAGAILPRLIPEVDGDAEPGERALELSFKMRGVARAAAPRVGRLRIGPAEELLHVRTDLGDVDGDFAQPVEIIPGKEQPRPLSQPAQRAADKIAGGDVPEIADVHRAGRADARGADVFRLVRMALDQLPGDGFGPMHGDLS